jgi:chitin-binding protein
VTAGSSIRFSYRTTIPHAGSFRMYVTRDSYDPTKPLTWSDLESKPFLTASNPPITGGAYVMPGRLPAAKTGRHMIYTIWQTTSTPDTYYSCSDAVFVAGAGAGAPAPGASRPAAVPPDAAQATDGAQPPTQQQPNLPTGTAVAPAPGANSVPIARASNSVGRMAPVAAVGLAVLAVAGAAGAFIWRRRRI